MVRQVSQVTLSSEQEPTLESDVEIMALSGVEALGQLHQLRVDFVFRQAPKPADRLLAIPLTLSLSHERGGPERRIDLPPTCAAVCPLAIPTYR